MNADERLNELMLRWEEARQRGTWPQPEALCAECPQLADALRERIDAVAAMERVLGVNHRPPEVVPTLHGASPDDGNDGVGRIANPSHEHLPTVPGYDILKLLDQGGMGVVYQAKQRDLGRTVAVKMISVGRVSPRTLGRFQREAEAAARLQHPNFVQVFEVGHVDGRPFFSMEFVDGGSLAQRIAGERFAPRASAELVRTLARAIHAAHERGVVHRDLKPANIMLTADGVPKIADFGLAKRLDEEGGHTHSGEILGTPSYMAPEQAEGRKHDMGPATDVYALGVILYELLTGKPPHQADSMLESLRRVLTEDPVAPSKLASDIPRDLDAICLKCLEKAPSMRYASGDALADDLDRFLTGQPVVARHIGPLRRVGKWMRRHPQTAALTGLLTVLVIAGVVLLIDWQRSQQRARLRAHEVAPLAREILERNCFECHGHNPDDVKKGLNILDHGLLLTSARRIVVPGKPQESRLLQRIADGSMPPEEEETRLPRLSEDELTILNDWILGGAPPLPPPDPDRPVLRVVPRSELAAQVQAIFQERCYLCHKYDIAKGGIKIMHHRLLVNVRQVVKPFRPDESELMQDITTKDFEKRMPPPPRPRVPAAEVAIIRQWIAEGAPPFPRKQ